MIDDFDLIDWHDPAPNRALIVLSCISGAAVMIGVAAVVWALAKWGWL